MRNPMLVYESPIDNGYYEIMSMVLNTDSSTSFLIFFYVPDRGALLLHPESSGLTIIH